MRARLWACGVAWASMPAHTLSQVRLHERRDVSTPPTPKGSSASPPYHLPTTIHSPQTLTHPQNLNTAPITPPRPQVDQHYGLPALDASPGLSFRLKVQRFLELVRARAPPQSILEYGRAQLAPAAAGPEDEELLSDAVSLLAYAEPEASPCGTLLLVSARPPCPCLRPAHACAPAPRACACEVRRARARHAPELTSAPLPAQAWLPLPQPLAGLPRLPPLS